MLKKIISCAESGVGQAALDAAIKLEIPHGGWALPTGKGETRQLPKKYRVQQIEGSDRVDAARQNLIDSDGTLLMSHGGLSRFSDRVRAIAMDFNQPCLHVDLNSTTAFSTAQTINQWVRQQKIEILHVAGARTDQDPNIYQSTLDILEAFFYLHLMDTGMPSTDSPDAGTPGIGSLPRSVEQAVALLIPRMTLKDKTTLANMTEGELVSLDSSLGEYIRNTFELWTGNPSLLESCRRISDGLRIESEHQEMVIIRKLWEELRETHVLRIVK
ncbi:hypothetical protein D3OALGA1CA_5015 [Olavius algarvensis associated proteobacterium Delta 3]|nr:hypothetical protein D3OALGA1CA_5015 [Olavius algarvensis associated proteobacterium Delta 3]